MQTTAINMNRRLGFLDHDSHRTTPELRRPAATSVGIMPTIATPPASTGSACSTSPAPGTG